jgi:transcriptional regulator with GAF, ATPase, and Fis domain
MLVVSRDLRISRLNSGFAEFLARSSDDCLNLSLTEVLPQVSETMGRIVNQVIIARKPLKESVVEFDYKKDFYCWSISAYPLANDERRIDKVNLIIHDITELQLSKKKLERAYEDILELQEKLKQENQLLRREISQTTDQYLIIGSSNGIKKVLQQISQVAPTDTVVLISGETGTGKELVARALHQKSNRKSQPLVIVNCAALPANLIESELFGHEKGSFTGAINRKTGKFELADRGTLFLDEIGELPLELQSKLLRVLQESQIERVGGIKTINIDTRIIAATNRDLLKEVKEGRFREDLYFRINVFPIELPPLRERNTDIIEISQACIRMFAERMGKPVPALDQSSISALLNYDWPGNIRELRNLIERALILCTSDTLNITLPSPMNSKSEPNRTPRNFTKLADVEKLHITEVMRQCSWRVRGKDGAAELLGLKPTTLESRMKKLNISRPV